MAHYSISQCKAAELICKYWSGIKNPPPFGFHPVYEEKKILAKLDTLYPDNVEIVIDTLDELAFFNKIYPREDIITVAELCKQLASQFAISE